MVITVPPESICKVPLIVKAVPGLKVADPTLTMVLTSLLRVPIPIARLAVEITKFPLESVLVIFLLPLPKPTDPPPERVIDCPFKSIFVAELLEFKVNPFKLLTITLVPKANCTEVAFSMAKPPNVSVPPPDIVII